MMSSACSFMSSYWQSMSKLTLPVATSSATWFRQSSLDQLVMTYWLSDSIPWSLLLSLQMSFNADKLCLMCDTHGHKVESCDRKYGVAYGKSVVLIICNKAELLIEISFQNDVYKIRTLNVIILDSGCTRHTFNQKNIISSI